MKALVVLRSGNAREDGQRGPRPLLNFRYNLFRYILYIIRYNYESEIKEIFFGFIHCEKLEAPSLFATIKNTLIKNGILLENCVGQTYDGASVRSGHLNGVQALFKKEVPSAVYVHCYNHVLNLAVVDCCKGIPEFSQFFNMREQLYVFMSHSSIHTGFLNVQKILSCQITERTETPTRNKMVHSVQNV